MTVEKLNNGLVRLTNDAGQAVNVHWRRDGKFVVYRKSDGTILAEVEVPKD
jgi:Tol biopolymer transport system component